jgi:DNA-binding transcriptional MerR regulator
MRMVQGSNSSEALRSGALAKVVGLSSDTIRHYERMGVIARVPRTASGYRLYPISTVERVLVVQRALRIGFTLPELAEVLKARDAGGAPSQRVYELAQAKLTQIAMDIQALRRTKRYLESVLRDWEQKLQRARPGQPSHLLHTLSEAPMPANDCRRLQRRKRT